MAKARMKLWNRFRTYYIRRKWVLYYSPRLNNVDSGDWYVAARIWSAGYKCCSRWRRRDVLNHFLLHSSALSLLCLVLIIAYWYPLQTSFTYLPSVIFRSLVSSVFSSPLPILMVPPLIIYCVHITYVAKYKHNKLRVLYGSTSSRIHTRIFISVCAN